MRKLFVFTVFMLGCVSMYAQNEETKEALKAANDIIYDVAHGKMERFNWLTVQEVPLLFHPNDIRNNNQWKEIFGNPEKELTPALLDIKREGTSCGIDWNNVVVTDIRFQGNYDEDFGAEEMKGYIYLKSRGKTYRLFFKRGFLLNGKWRCILPRNISQTSEIPLEYPKSGKN